MVKTEDSYLLVASEIYDIKDSSNIKILSEDELKLLPMKLHYCGPPTQFKIEEKEAFRCLFSIISKMNSLQDLKFASFPLGKTNIKM